MGQERLDPMDQLEEEEIRSVLTLVLYYSYCHVQGNNGPNGGPGAKGGQGANGRNGAPGPNGKEVAMELMAAQDHLATLANQ